MFKLSSLEKYLASIFSKMVRLYNFQCLLPHFQEQLKIINYTPAKPSPHFENGGKLMINHQGMPRIFKIHLAPVVNGKPVRELCSLCVML